MSNNDSHKGELTTDKTFKPEVLSDRQLKLTENKVDDTIIVIKDYKFHLYGLMRGSASVDGKPFMKYLSAMRNIILRNDNVIYEDSLMYTYYLTKNYWPRVINYSNGKDLVLIEQSNDEPNGSQVIGLIVDGNKVKLKFETFIRESSEYYTDSALFRLFQSNVENPDRK